MSQESLESGKKYSEQLGVVSKINVGKYVGKREMTCVFMRVFQMETRLRVSVTSAGMTTWRKLGPCLCPITPLNMWVLMTTLTASTWMGLNQLFIV